MTTVPQDPDELDEPDLPDVPEEPEEPAHDEPSDVRPDGGDDANEADVVEQALGILDGQADDYR